MIKKVSSESEAAEMKFNLSSYIPESHIKVSEIKKAFAEGLKLSYISSIERDLLREDFLVDWSSEGTKYGFLQSGADSINLLITTFNQRTDLLPNIGMINVEHKVPYTSNSKYQFAMGTISGAIAFEGISFYAELGAMELLSYVKYLKFVSKANNLDMIDGMKYLDELTDITSGSVSTTYGPAYQGKGIEAIKQKIKWVMEIICIEEKIKVY